MAVEDMAKLDTWPKVLENNGRRFSNGQKAMRYKHYGIWQAYSWQDYYTHVKDLALGLLSLGFEQGNKLLIIGDNSPVFFFAQLAAQCNRGMSVGLYSDSSATEIEFVARDCAAEFAMVEDEEQADKISLIRERLPHLKAVVFWRYKGMSDRDTNALVGHREAVERGRRYEQEHPGLFEQNVAATQGDDICSIVYTSGTTRLHPKGALHSYRSLMAASRLFCEHDGLGPKDDLACYLPPAWISEQWLGFGAHLLSGAVFNFPEDAETQQGDIREIAPTVVAYNSRLWERQAAQVRARLAGAGFLKRLASDRLLPIGYRTAGLRYEKGEPGRRLRLMGHVAERVLFRPVRDSLGLPRARVCYSTGSALPEDTVRFLHAVNVPLKSVFGSAEAGAVTGAADRVQPPSSVGSVNPNVEIAFGEQGEIRVRHAGTFLGYLNDDEKTSQVMADGWVATGDQGYLNGHRELVFVDRLQDLIALRDGAVVSPQSVEGRLKCSPFIRDAWVFAGRDAAHLSAVIVIDAVSIGRWADKRKVAYTTYGHLSRTPEVYELVGQEISAANKDLAENQRISNYTVLPREFDPDESEVTRDRKLRRSLLQERYAALIAAIGIEDAGGRDAAEASEGTKGTSGTGWQIANVRRDG